MRGYVQLKIRLFIGLFSWKPLSVFCHIMKVKCRCLSKSGGKRLLKLPSAGEIKPPWNIMHIKLYMYWWYRQRSTAKIVQDARSRKVMTRKNSLRSSLQWDSSTHCNHIMINTISVCHGCRLGSENQIRVNKRLYDRQMSSYCTIRLDLWLFLSSGSQRWLCTNWHSL